MDRITEIERVLDLRVRPLLYAHNGDVKVEAFRDGILKVRLLGQCCNCPSASDTTKDLIETELQAELPWIRSVCLMMGVSDELLAQARKLLIKG